MRVEKVYSAKAPKAYLKAFKPMLDRLFRWKRLGVKIDILLSPAHVSDHLTTVVCDIFLGIGGRGKWVGPGHFHVVESVDHQVSLEKGYLH